MPILRDGETVTVHAKDIRDTDQLFVKWMGFCVGVYYGNYYDREYRKTAL